MPINKLGKHFLNKTITHYCVLPIYGTDCRIIFTRPSERTPIGASYDINYGEDIYQFPLAAAEVDDVYIHPPNTLILINDKIFTRNDLIGYTFSKNDKLRLVNPFIKIAPRLPIKERCFVQFVLKCEA